MKIFKITDRKVLRFKYREDINGLRALSVVSVILYHLDINLFGKKLFISGYLGVDVFFIISGFLISNIIISELTNNTFMFKSFYERRIRRVFPTLFITILISFFSSFMILTPKPMNEFLKSALAALLFVSNIFFSKLDFYNAEPTQVMPLLHTWSLGIEEQFYLLFPILCFTLYKYFKSYFLEIISLIAVISIFFNLGAGNVKFYLLQFRMWELLIGVILSTLFINFKLNLKYIKSIGFLILIYTLNSFDETSILQIEPKILIAFAVSLILISDNKNTYFDKLCNLKIIKNLGLISYSLYLFHQPLFAFAKIYIQKNTLEFTNINQNDYFLFQSFKSITPVLIAILFLISNLNYFFIEKKFINKTFNLKVLRNFFFILIVLLIIGILNNGYSIRYRNLPSELIEYENNRTNDLEAVTGYTCWEVPITENCQFDIGSKTNLYLFGDSHLSQLSLYFYSLKEVYDYNLYVLTGCIKYINSPTPNSKCVNQGNLNFYNEYLNNISNAYIVYFIFAEMEIEKYPKDFESYIENTLNKLIENNNKIILVYPAPVMNVSVAEYFLINNLDLNEVIKIDYNSFNKNQNIQNIYKIYNKFNNPNIIRIYPEEIFCNTYVKNSCVGSFDKKLFYYDNNHFSKDGAYLLGYKITSELFNIK